METPDEIVAQLAGIVKEVVEDPEFIALCDGLSIVARYRDTEEYTAFNLSEDARFENLIKTKGFGDHIAAWEKAGVRLPAFDIEAMRAHTKEKPVWVHFGAGNIFRAFIAALQQRLLDSGDAQCGIIAADTFDPDNIRMIFGANDELTMSVTLNADATIDKEIIASVSEALAASPATCPISIFCGMWILPIPKASSTGACAG